MFKNLHELIATMPDEKTCRDYLAKARWEDGKAICPYCGHGKCYVIENGWRYKCGSKECHKKFSVTVGTIFEASNIPLNKWFMAVYLCTAHKKGISSYQLGKDIGVSQKCAWFMLHRIRELMRVKTEIKLDNIVEVDEVYIGGKVSNMSKRKRTMLREAGMALRTKTMVVGMIERAGDLKLIAMGKDNSYQTMQPVIKENVDKDAVVITDSLASYVGLNEHFAAHEAVNHTDYEYVRDSVFHTNTIEGAFSHFKRSIYGIYHQVSVKHLSRYCDETMYRYNFRKMKDTGRFIMSLGKSNGRLKYKNLIASKGDPHENITVTFAPTMMEKFYGNKKRVLQIKNGEIVGRYPTISEASRSTGLSRERIRDVIKGKRVSHGGYEWKYE
jgi:transposase-like protein